MSHLPQIQIEISQPGDRGNFVIRTVDKMTGKEIYENRLPETISDTQHLYTAHLLERRVSQVDNALIEAAAKIDSSWKKTDRYKDIVRYGQKLYTDLFGTNNKIRNHIQRAKHLKDGISYVLSLDRTASELWNIPWEYLHDGEDFIALRPETTIVRALANSPFHKKFGELRQIPRPLRVLVMISDPKGAAPLDVDQEVQNIMDALDPAVKAGSVVVDVLEEGSLRNLDIALADETYHILHYTGHGAMTNKGSCLALEDERGDMKPAFIEDLLPIINHAKSLRLIILSGCQTGQIDETHAMSGIATGLLAAVPAVVAMQFSIADLSAQVFGRTFFQSIGQGQSLEDAMHNARLEMNKANPAFGDWGMPTLYVNKLEMQLVEAGKSRLGAADTKAIDLATLPPSKMFVGRRDEQRQLRAIIPQLRVNMVYIWGMWGIGKSALVSRILQRPGRKEVIESTLIISCANTQPAEIVERLAAWLEPISAPAAEALRNPRLNPEQRVREAAKHIRRRRLVLVFDGFEAYQQQSADQHHWEAPNALLENFMRLLASADWSILTMFTSRYRWRYLNERNDEFMLELHLNEINPYELGMLLGRLPHLRKLNFEALNRLFAHCGGHPATVQQLETSASRDTKGILASEEMTKRLAKWWHTKWFEAVIARLTPAERSALQSISVLKMPFWVGYVQVVAKINSRQAAESMMARWEASSLVHFIIEERGTDRAWYEVHPMVAAYMLHECSPVQLKQLHKEAATLLELDLAHLAELRYEDMDKKPPAGMSTYELAREELRLIMEFASVDIRMIVVKRALSWRRHLMEIKDYERAANIVNDTWGNLAYRFQAGAMARAMLEETVATAKGRQQVLARSNIADFLVQEGKIDQAMKMYDDSLRELTKLNDEYNVSVVLSQQAGVYHRLGKFDRALKLAEQALQLSSKLNDSAGQSQVLRQIATLYAEKQRFPDALKYITMAEKIARSIEDWDSLLIALNTKGMILKYTKKYQEAFECFQEGGAIAQKMGVMSEVGNSLSEIGELLRLVGRPSEAAHPMLDSVSIAEQLQDQRALAMRLFRMAMIYSMQGNNVEARSMAERALGHAKSHAPHLVGDIQSLMRKLPRR